MKSLQIFVAATLMLGLLGACDERLEISNPNAPTTADFWLTPEHAAEGLIAVYSGYIIEGTYMRMLPAATDGRGDDFRGSSPWVAYVQQSTFTIPPTDPTVQWVWRDHYQVIFRANQVLDNIRDIAFEDEGHKNRIIGQASFLRGLAYFNLFLNYNKIPLVDEDNYNRGDNFFPPVASKEAVWTQIEADFAQAKDLLPWDFDEVTGPDQGQTGRATKGAAIGMLGKSYLYQEKWQAAYDEFDALMQSGRHALVANYNENFWPGPQYENNEESLFEIQFSHDIGGTTVNWCCEPVNTWMNVTGLGQTYAMTAFGGWSDFVPSRGLYEAFKQERTVEDKLDPRLNATIASYEPGEDTEVYNQPWPASVPNTNIYAAKYTYSTVPGYTSEGGGTATYSAINYRVLRYADVLLMAAEALNEMGRTAEAAPLIQQVRSRANLPDRSAEFAAMSQVEMRDQIAHERYLELAVEGIRIHDLIRWGWLQDPQKLELLKQRDPDFNTYSVGNEYLPIPQSELDANPNLERNSAN
jgi:starch-binding outer membrane protein, SusD/RagB family